MSLPTFYAQEMLDLHNKYNLSENARTLLRAHDQWRMGQISQEELGRMVRMSPKMRQAIIDTITKVNNTMKKKPGEQKICIEIIQACTDMLTALEAPKEVEGFPFMKLPPEVRENVYAQYLNATLLQHVGAVTIGERKNTKCICPKYAAGPYSAPRQIDLALARTSSTIRDELLRYFYAHFSMNFTCACELSHRMKANMVLRMAVRKVKIHWTGPKSAEAFRILARCQKLKQLAVVVSRSTTANLTPRETEMRTFFAGLRQVRLVDALGMDELLQIRGISHVNVLHPLAKMADRRSEEERANLLGLLQAKLTQRRPGQDGDDDYDDAGIF